MTSLVTKLRLGWDILYRNMYVYTYFAWTYFSFLTWSSEARWGRARFTMLSEKVTVCSHCSKEHQLQHGWPSTPGQSPFFTLLPLAGLKEWFFPCPTSLVNSLRKNSLQVSMPASQRTFMTDQRNTFLCSRGVFLSSQTFAHWWSRIARSPESWAQWNHSLLSVETRTAFGAQNPFSFTHQ